MRMQGGGVKMVGPDGLRDGPKVEGGGCQPPERTGKREAAETRSEAGGSCE